MPLKNTALQGQLDRAKAELDRVAATLGEQTPKKNPVWRRANSRVQQIEGRMNSRTAVRNTPAASDSEDA